MLQDGERQRGVTCWHEITAREAGCAIAGTGWAGGVLAPDDLLRYIGAVPGGDGTRR